MSQLYSPLKKNEDEIRLINILPTSTDTGVVHCRLKTYSLKAYCHNYREFMSTTSLVDLNKRQIISRWTQSQAIPDLFALPPIRRIHATRPPPSYHRFEWGDYAALSYVWGDAEKTSTIMINNRTIEVTQNLEKALREFSKQAEFNHGFHLWVDAICINQNDRKERERQIRRMRDIYGNSWMVVGWLGEEHDRSSSAIQLVRDLAALGQHSCGEKVEAALSAEMGYLGGGCWLALQELMERPYWDRLWIIQEIVMGAWSTWLRCGSTYIEWESFCAGVVFLQEHLWLVKDDVLWKEIQTLNSPRGMGWTITSLHLVYHDLAVLSRLSEEGSNEYLSFGRLLDLASNTECTDPRDKVYSIAALIDPHIAQYLTPDYSQTTSEVYTTAAKAFIQGYQNLEPLREANPWGPNKTPSWVADWQYGPRDRWSRVESPLWGPEWLVRQSTIGAPYITYCASKGTRHDATFLDDPRLLQCTGFIVDSISGLSAYAIGYFKWSQNSVIQSAQWHSVYGNHEDTARALYRTLISDRVSGMQRASERHAAIFHLPSTFEKASKQFEDRSWRWLAAQELYYFRWEEFRRVNRNFMFGNVPFDQFFTDDIPPDASERDLVELYSCAERSSKNRRLMTTSNGYMGWAPDNANGSRNARVKDGDLIAIIFGCSTPIVIRPYRRYYRVLGEAYVQGLMDGEAIGALEAGKYQPQQFTFC